MIPKYSTYLLIFIELEKVKVERMFSFFKSKKPSPSSSPESEPIPGQGDFVVVEPKVGGDTNPTQPNLYPHFDQNTFGYPPAMPPVNPMKPATNENAQNISYLHGVPFKLSSELSIGDSTEITKIQIDDILSVITSKMEVSQLDYDFGLERSIIAQEVTE